MNTSLNGLRKSPYWKKKLSGFIELDGTPLTDWQVRQVVEKGIANGYNTLDDIPDDLALEWIKPKTIK